MHNYGGKKEKRKGSKGVQILCGVFNILKESLHKISIHSGSSQPYVAVAFRHLNFHRVQKQSCSIFISNEKLNSVKMLIGIMIPPPPEKIHKRKRKKNQKIKHLPNFNKWAHQIQMLESDSACACLFSHSDNVDVLYITEYEWNEIQRRKRKSHARLKKKKKNMQEREIQMWRPSQRGPRRIKITSPHSKPKAKDNDNKTKRLLVTTVCIIYPCPPIKH